MKHLLVTTIAALVLVGCASTQLSESPTVKAPDISIHKAADDGNIEAIKQHIAAGTGFCLKGQSGILAEVTEIEPMLEQPRQATARESRRTRQPLGSLEPDQPTQAVGT